MTREDCTVGRDGHPWRRELQAVAALRQQSLRHGAVLQSVRAQINGHSSIVPESPPVFSLYSLCLCKDMYDIRE